MTAKSSKSNQQLQFLQTPELWAGFERYLAEDWQARQLLETFVKKGGDLGRVIKSAI